MKIDTEGAPIAEQVVDALLREVKAELYAAMAAHAPMHSAHEGFAVIMEEQDELWREVTLRPAERSVDRMRNEARQVAAMAVRFMFDICCTRRGDVVIGIGGGR